MNGSFGAGVWVGSRSGGGSAKRGGWIKMLSPKCRWGGG